MAEKKRFQRRQTAKQPRPESKQTATHQAGHSPSSSVLRLNAAASAVLGVGRPLQNLQNPAALSLARDAPPAARSDGRDAPSSSLISWVQRFQRAERMKSVANTACLNPRVHG